MHGKSGTWDARVVLGVGKGVPFRSVLSSGLRLYQCVSLISKTSSQDCMCVSKSLLCGPEEVAALRERRRDRLRAKCLPCLSVE